MKMARQRKSTMVELVTELEKLPPSALRDMVIEEAKAGEFHDYKNEKYVCGKVAVVGYLRQLDAEPLAQRVIDGEFDEEADEQDRKMLGGLIKEMAMGKI
jgi:hypothetical protein